MNMINILCEYIKYQLNARRRHGIHSPFVYDFGDKCLNSIVSDKDLQTFKDLRSSFLRDLTLVKINEPQTPLRKSTSTYSIREITKMAGINNKIGKLIFRMISYYPVKNALEIGTGTGQGTYMLSSGNRKAKITTIETNVDLFNFVKSHFPPSRTDKVEFINDSFTNYLNSQENSSPFDLVLINASPREMNNIKDILSHLEALIHDETIILINGIRKSNELFEIWKEIKTNSNYHLSIDLFQVGVLLQRNHQEKQHFVIRY